MKDDMDFIGDLRAAWKASQASPPKENLAECDEGTRFAVDLLRDGWKKSQAAKPPVAGEQACKEALRLSRPASRPSLRRPFGRRRFAMLAAAAIFLLASGLLWRALQSGPSPVQPDYIAKEESNAAKQSGVTEENSAIEPSVPARPNVPKVTVRRDGVEMRSGNVRLVLIDTPKSQSKNL